MSNLHEISQALYLLTHDPRKELLDKQRKEAKQQLRELVSFWGWDNVQLWLDNIPDDESLANRVEHKIKDRS